MNKDRILTTLATDEGFKAKAYWDVKQWTYGFGCKAPCEGAVITRTDALTLLSKRVDQAIKEFYEIFAQLPMTEARQEALVNMIFNLGKGGLLGFHNMVAAIWHDDWDKVADEAMDSKWYRQTGNRAKRIVNELRTGEFA